MVTSFVVAAALAAGAVGGNGAPVTVEIAALGHVETPADRYRVTGDVLACAATQAEADAELARKVATIEATMRGIGVGKARALERASLAGMMATLTTRGTRNCNTVDIKDVLGKPGASLPKEAPVQRVGASAAVAFDAPSRAVATRAIAVLKDADAKPAEKPIAMLVDDTPARRAAKQQALAKARAEAAAYAGSLGMGAPTLTRISEKQDWNSVDFAGQMVRMIGLTGANAGDAVATDVTLTVEFRLGAP